MLNDINATPYCPHLRTGASLALTDNAGLDTPTLFRSRPSVYIAGARLSLAYRHYSPATRCPHLSSMSWVTVNAASAESPSLGTRESRTLLSPSYAPALPTLDNLSGSSLVPNTEASSCPDIDLGFLRYPLKPSKQHLLWAGADASTGAGSTSLGSTEDHGWVSPVPAREASLRSALASRSSASQAPLFSSAAFSLTAAVAPLLPFDVNARALLAHPTGAPSLLGTLPFTWSATSAALEADIDAASQELWLNALIPDASFSALHTPASLVNRQFTLQNLRTLQAAFTGTALAVAGQPLSAFAPSVGGVPVKTRTSPSANSYVARGTALFPAIVGGSALKTACYLATPYRLANLTFSAPMPMMVGRQWLAQSWLEPLPPRSIFTPSSLGFGLDETRLVRTGASKLADSALIANKLEGLASPSLALPNTPVSLLSLGWSTSASLSSYPSYKLARGGTFRRPFTGLTANPRVLEGLKEPFPLLNLTKATLPIGAPRLALSRPAQSLFRASAPSLDTQVGSWASVWSVVTPAPTEDLDPTFINTA